MRYLIPLFSVILLTTIVVGCGDAATSDVPNEIQGLKPVYSDGVNWNKIGSESARPIHHLGKMFYKDNLIFANEIGAGFHVIDNTDPSNPKPVHFLSIPGSKDISIKGNYMYVDNLEDLVTLDISDLSNIIEIDRQPGLYEAEKNFFPEGYTGYFECVDSEIGKVLYWEEALLVSPKCRM